MILVEEKRDILNRFKDKKVLVVGLARSGTGAANLLKLLGADVTVNDSKSREALDMHIRLLSEGVEIVTGGNPAELFTDAEMIVISPGVPHDIPPLLKAKMRGTPIIGELELAYQTAAGFGLRVAGETLPGACKSRLAAASLIGITGTNGKSTVTTLIDLMLERSGYRTLMGGNIGNAMTEEIMTVIRDEVSGVGDQGSEEERSQPHIDFIVAEISSFQLETIAEFRPNIGVILNITADHLDRYEGIDDYAEAKARIFENQGAEDFLVLNADDPVLDKLRAEKLGSGRKDLPNVLFFSRKKEVEGVCLKDGTVYCNLPGLPLPTSRFPLINLNNVRIKGVHNLENAMAASLTALISGASPDAVTDVLRSFPGLEHRMEDLGEKEGVRFINDSKGTNTGAVMRSLEGLKDVILIMGGTDKGSDFSVLSDPIRNKVKFLVVIGEARDKIERALGGAVRTIKADSMNEAVRVSFSEAAAGDVVLLSPGCASFDMFKDFEDRGGQFKKAVEGLSSQG